MPPCVSGRNPSLNFFLSLFWAELLKYFFEWNYFFFLSVYPWQWLQSVISVNSTEAEVVAANHFLRAKEIPMLLALFQELNLFQQGRKPAAVVGEPKTGGGEEYITRIDPEIDEIRNGNVDSGIKASDINGLTASLPDFYQIKFMENNPATITVCQSGSSASMRHTNKTQNISFKWIKQQFEKEQFDMLNVGTNFQVADVFRKPFPEPKKWEHALRLIGIGATKIPRCRQKASPVVSAAGITGDHKDCW